MVGATLPLRILKISVVNNTIGEVVISDLEILVATIKEIQIMELEI